MKVEILSVHRFSITGVYLLQKICESPWHLELNLIIYQYITRWAKNLHSNWNFLLLIKISLIKTDNKPTYNCNKPCKIQVKPTLSFAHFQIPCNHISEANVVMHSYNVANKSIIYKNWIIRPKTRQKKNVAEYSLCFSYWSQRGNTCMNSKIGFL